MAIFDEIVLSKEGVDRSQWAKLTCSAALELEINSTVKATAFQGDGSAPTIGDNLTVNGAIATKQLSVSDSLTVDNDLTVGNAIATNQLSVSD